jgi:hypothetical protein
MARAIERRGTRKAYSPREHYHGRGRNQWRCISTHLPRRPSWRHQLLNPSTAAVSRGTWARLSRFWWVPKDCIQAPWTSSDVPLVGLEYWLQDTSRNVSFDPCLFPRCYCHVTLTLVFISVLILGSCWRLIVVSKFVWTCKRTCPPS